jgi:hypothetical protein
MVNINHYVSTPIDMVRLGQKSYVRADVGKVINRILIE